MTRASRKGPAQMNYCMRVLYEPRGEHTHMRIYIGQTDTTLALAGELVMRNEEFAAWKQYLLRTEFKPEAFDDDAR